MLELTTLIVSITAMLLLHSRLRPFLASALARVVLAYALVAIISSSFLLVLETSFLRWSSVMLWLTFAGLLYTFIFTLSQGSISIKILEIVSAGPVARAALLETYSPTRMVARRIERMCASGLLVQKDKQRYSLSRRGNSIAAVFRILRRLLHATGYDSPEQRLAFVLGVFVFCALFLPYVLLTALSVSAVPLYEEPIGYRYFYSLRIIFGGETPWIPQGHTVGLLHHGVQFLLSIIGFPVADIGARIEAFTLVSLLFWSLAISATLAAALKRISNSVLSFFIVAALVALVNAADGEMIWYTYPDYQIVTLLLAIVSLIWCIELILNPAARRLTFKTALLLALFAGLALGNKITNVVYPITLGLVYIYYGRSNILPLAISVALSLAFFAGIITLYYWGNSDGVRVFIDGLRIFIPSQVQSAGSIEAISYFFLKMRPNEFFDLIWVAPVLAVINIGLAIFRRASVMICFIPSMVIILYFLFQRFYSWSAIEVHVYTWLVISVGSLVLSSELSARRHFFRRQSLTTGATFALIGILTVMLVTERVHARSKTIKGYNHGYQAIIEEVGSARMLVLVPNNTYRLPSALSSLCKGGGNIFHPVWGDSPYISSLFPDFVCAVVPQEINLDELERVVFRRLDPDDLEAATRRLEEYFGISLNQFVCDFSVDIPLGSFVMCSRE